MVHIIKPPEPIVTVYGTKSVFLAGSIDLGASIDWQAAVELALSDMDITLFNPRRTMWDIAWQPDSTDPNFREQVSWELAALEQADLIACYFAPRSKAPITLLELGLFARTGKCVVCCPKEYWRHGNVDIVCQTYNVPIVQDLPDLVKSVRARLA
jgi:hypothetical protein